MKLAPFVLPLLVSLRLVAADAGSLTDFFPPDTKVAFGIRVHNLAMSPAAASFTAQAQAAGSAWLKALPLKGFDLLRDIDEVLVASCGGGRNPPAILVVTGRFDVARLAQGARRYHDVPVLGGEKEPDSLVALLDGATALVGNPALVLAAIDQRDGAAKIEPALADRVASLRQRYDIWGVGEQPEGFVAPTPEAQGLESIDRFQFGVQLARGLELGAEIHARTPQDAEKLRASLGMVAAMLKAQQPSGSATKFAFEVEDGNLKLTVSIPEEELKRTIQMQTAAASQKGAPTAPPQAPPRPTSSQVLDPEGNTVILKLPGKQ